MKQDAQIEWAAAYAGRTKRMHASEIRELFKLLAQPDIISFAGGIPDPALFQNDAVRQAYGAILDDARLAPQSLQYSVSEGYERLRQWIVEHMGRLGVPCEVGNIVITSGSQRGLDFLGKLFPSAGDTALVTAPTYLGALQAFNAYEPRYDVLTLGEDRGTAATYRDAAKAAGGRVALAYIVPAFANPTGETESKHARDRLLKLSTDLDIPVIEDAAYQAFGAKPAQELACLIADRLGPDEEPPVLALRRA